MDVTGPPLAHGFHAVDPADLACIVTALEMTVPPAGLRRLSPETDVPLQMARWRAPDVAKYRALFVAIGAPWLWSSRLRVDDVALGAILNDPAVEVFVVTDAARMEVGMLELDFRTPGECLIAFFGLTRAASGRGLGRWLMKRALQLAWRPQQGGMPAVGRVWVHTCTLDDPRALGFYIRQGFTAFARSVEILPDPRHAGLLPPDAAAREPLIEI
ncbi:GNAT family N-acetyltransferase [Novosphingobium lentum]|uniref:GNAT family N-acetyltransferase n=1 Tax=Novosphingobium lentum TaxID=145287 RepID=UPI00082B72F8|nr:GNAT family N-acetyltransferase [Novosphingobium lentum]